LIKLELMTKWSWFGVIDGYFREKVIWTPRGGTVRFPSQGCFRIWSENFPKEKEDEINDS